MTLTATDGGWQVTAPSCRFDISIEEDLVEEIGRIYGYERIPSHRGMSAMAMRGRQEAAFDLHRAKQSLVDRDYQEVITYSFVSPEIQQMIDPDLQGVKLANPISAEMSVMRTSLWPGLLQTAQYNQSRQQERIRIFETGLNFQTHPAGIEQEPMLAGLIAGARQPEQWDGKQIPVDFFDLKADLEAVLALTGADDEFVFRPAAHSALHPGQTAAIDFRGQPIGWIGMLHPELEKRLDLAGPTYLFEIKLRAVEMGILPAFEALSKYPSIRRDIALVVDQAVSFEEIRSCIRDLGLKNIQDIRLFDVYTGENIDSGRKSLALGLILQEKSHTLTDQEVDEVVNTVLHGLAKELDAKLRD